MDNNESDFEKWISEKQSKPKKKGTYRERVLSGQQEHFTAKKRSRLRSRSKKQKKKESEYSKASKKYLKENPCCEVCGTPDNLSIHHKKGRSGSLISDPEFFMTACLVGRCLDVTFPESNHNHTGGCHGWIEANKRIAREKGWIL